MICVCPWMQLSSECIKINFLLQTTFTATEWTKKKPKSTIKSTGINQPYALPIANSPIDSLIH